MDLYAVLGVAPDASANEIDRAYRRLARRYHPGVNPGDPQAAERFRQVDDAYRILGDAQQRARYDRGALSAPANGDPAAAVSFAGFDFSAAADGTSAGTFAELFAGVFHDAARRATASTRGLEIHATLRLPFEAAVRGGQFPLSVVRQDRCAHCEGHGWTAMPPVWCPECEGRGTRRWVRGHMVFTKSCDRCSGAGQLSSQLCRGCGGAGVQTRGEVVTVQVPPGIESGARLVVSGRGHAVRGAAPGDLYVTVEVAEHRVFRRSGRDLIVTVPVAVHEAALGARIDVPTLEGPVKLRVPPGTASGQQFRLRGRGIPSPSGDPADAGDLLVHLQIVLPPVRDERSRELLREFGRLNDVDVRKHLFE